MLPPSAGYLLRAAIGLWLLGSVAAVRQEAPLHQDPSWVPCELLSSPLGEGLHLVLFDLEKP